MKKVKIAHFSSRITSAFAQLSILVVVPMTLSIDDQGYYFLFASIIALQYICELGSTQVLAIKISALTEVSRHKNSNLLDITSETKYISHEKSPLKMTIELTSLMFTIIALSFFFASTIAAFFLVDPVNSNSGTNLMVIWVINAIFVSFNIKLNSLLMVGENIGYMSKISRLKTLVYLLSGIAFSATAFFTKNLYSIIASPLANCLVVLLFLKYNPQLSALFRKSKSYDYKLLFRWWQKYVFPVQWKMSISWICGYASFSLVNLFIFKSLGPDAIAMYGLSATIFTGISQLASSPVMAIQPNLSSLYSASMFNSRYLLFRKSLTQSILIYVCSSVCILGIISLLTSRTSLLNGRVLSPLNLSILACSYLLYLVCSCLGLYLRTTGTEPLLRTSLIIAITTASLCYIGSIISLDSIVYFFAVSMTIAFVLTLRIYFHNQKNLSRL